jgi:hypothetical protein
VSWDNPRDREVVVPYLLREMEEKMAKIKQNLKASYDKRKFMLIKEELTEILKWVTMCS